jgi:hypothetical protein
MSWVVNEPCIEDAEFARAGPNREPGNGARLGLDEWHRALQECLHVLSERMRYFESFEGGVRSKQLSPAP